MTDSNTEAHSNERGSLEPNLEKGRRFIESSSPPGEVMMCAVTGSHLYGFPSPDSDLDLKGVHIVPTERFLGLRSIGTSFDRLLVFAGLECDYTSHEIGTALRLLLNGNGNMLERLLSPIQLWRGPQLDSLADLARSAISKRFAAHYRGFFKGMCREHANAPRPKAKSLLYTYRVALTGIHLLESGRLVANLADLASEYDLEEAQELIEKKSASGERVELSQAEDKRFQMPWPTLEERLTKALKASRIPDEPLNRDACESWLVQLRRSRL